MSPGCSNRWLRRLRVFVLGLFAAALMLQPVLAAAGGLHELAHESFDMHVHGLHVDNVEAEPIAASEQSDDGARTLHMLLHFAHCCGAAAAMLPILDSPPAISTTGGLVIAITPILLQARLTSPFKPPISV